MGLQNPKGSIQGPKCLTLASGAMDQKRATNSSIATPTARKILILVQWRPGWPGWRSRKGARLSSI